ncbi:hypothetical protein DM860_015836 [Cuscuta australis]|uniref:GATA-type domain-containing protein n=1 Tax=Cuscuta australis TaxID=267555 RepID=A0A328E238_9ASTE|nr:hypothetical protein DM860_015836 [Cuscuta australis]
MGKQGPCCHCGITSTPLWRNGPPEKPILCNACGSRWRTKGTLANYTPMHCRSDLDDSDNFKGFKGKSLSYRNKEEKGFMKRKQNHYYPMAGAPPDHNPGLRRLLDEDMSNRSSSGSAASNSESLVELGGTEVSDLTGPPQPNAWDSTVPSRKRTCVARPKPSPVEKLTKDLHTILHEQQSFLLSGSSAEDLLLESDNPTMVCVEIGHGSMLIQHPSSIGREEESEASSLSVDNKTHLINEAYSCVATPVYKNYNDTRGVMNSQKVGSERGKQHTGQGIERELVKREKGHLEEMQNLKQLDSPVDPKGVNYKHSKICYEVAGGPDDIGSVNIKRSRDGQNQKPPVAKAAMKSPMKVTIKGTHQEHKDPIESDGNCFSPKHLFALPPDNSSLVFNSCGFTTESSEQDLLLEVPSNSSFPQAELLATTSSCARASASSSSCLSPTRLDMPLNQSFIHRPIEE